MFNLRSAKTEYHINRIDTLGVYFVINLTGKYRGEYDVIMRRDEMERFSREKKLRIAVGNVVEVRIKKYGAKKSPVTDIARNLRLSGRDFIVNGKYYSPQRRYYYLCW